MDAQNNIDLDFPNRFQKESIRLVSSLLELFAIRFCLVNPQMHIKGFVSENMEYEVEVIYQKQYTHLDPMHPSRFRNSTVTVVCSDTLMPAHIWKQTRFYQEFMAPRNYHHDTDMFFRRDNEIIAILTLLRDETLGRFTKEELDLLRDIHPFMEYTLNQVYLPKRLAERNSFSDKYTLTHRELDVLEFVMSGAGNKAVANELDLSLATVKTHLQHIFEKVGVHSSNELISKLYREINPN